jgi:hypothetical protein
MTIDELIEPHKAEIYLAVNENGEYDVGLDTEDAAERLRENCGGDQIRILCLNLDISAVVPEPVELEAALPKRDDGSFELAIKS